MACVNVNRSLSDQFYRYKMPKIIAKVEGKGNGIKTVIVNMVEVAKALNRPPMYPTKYFGCVLGAQVNCDLKNERYIVNGSHDSAKLQDLLDGFIQKYVLCPSCSNPETVIGVLAKKGIITSVCKACGYSGQINNKDKLTTYILKYPPTQTQNAVASSVQSSKKGKKSKKKDEGKDKQNGTNAKNGQSSPTQDSDEGNDNGENLDEDDDWCEDTDPDSVAKRMEELSAQAKGLMLNDDLEKPLEERLNIFFEYVKKKKEDNAGVFDVVMQKDIVSEAERLDIKDKAVLVLCEVLFDEKMLQQIKQHRLLLLRFTADSIKSQKYLLRGFELSVKLFKKQLVPRVAHLLKAFYDADILDEKVILEWGNKSNKKDAEKDEIRDKAGPFLKWLREAEEEDSDNSAEDEEIEVVYDDRVLGTKIQQIKEDIQEKQKQQNSANEPDDIDIDAI